MKTFIDFKTTIEYLHCGNHCGSHHKNKNKTKVQDFSELKSEWK